MSEELEDVCINLKIWIEITEDDIVTKTHLYRPCVLGSGYTVVASVNCKVGDWAAYVGIGNTMHIAETGDKTSKFRAEECFPEFKRVRWRL